MADASPRVSPPGELSRPPRPRIEGERVIVENVPETLRVLSQWVAWRYEWNSTKWTKVPINARTGRRASSTNPKTWTTFDVALAALEKQAEWDGLGIMFAVQGPLAGIDLDGCIDDAGIIASAAREIIDAIASYTEISPSGRGVKLVIVGRKPDNARCKSRAIRGFEAVEIYDRMRYFTVTGRRVPETPPKVEVRQSALEKLCARLWPKASSKPRVVAPPVRPSSASDDHALITKMRQARNGTKFAALFDRGDTAPYGGDDSAADQALACLIAFYTRDATRIEGIFSQSALGQRDKWRYRADYRERTIRAALDFVSGVATTPGAIDVHTRTTSAQDAASGAGSGVQILPMTDLGNAERLVANYGDDLRYSHATARWLVWDRKRWKEDDEGTPQRLAGMTARRILVEAAKCDHEETRAALAKWARTSESRHRIENMVLLARSRPQIVVRISELDADPWALNVFNGTVDLRTGELRPHRRQDLLTRMAGAEFDPAAPCPRFMAFLQQIFADDAAMIEYVRRLLGMCLTGDVREQILPIWYGVGANGKSVLIDLVKAIMGDFASNAPPNLLTQPRTQEHPTEIADLLGRRLVIASETEDAAAFKLQFVKRLTGDATLKGRYMRQDYFSFPRTHKLIVVTNNKPRVREDSEAVWRRLRLIPFDVVIPVHQRDPLLLSKLVAEGAGVLAWLVEGCLAWQRQGLGEPPAVADATNMYRAEEDNLGAFIEDRCVLDQSVSPEQSSLTVPWALLWKEYEA